MVVEEWCTDYANIRSLWVVIDYSDCRYISRKLEVVSIASLYLAVSVALTIIKRNIFPACSVSLEADVTLLLSKFLTASMITVASQLLSTKITSSPFLSLVLS